MRKQTTKPTVTSRWARGFAAPLGITGITLVLLAAWTTPVSAEHTRFWLQSDFEDFDSGTAHGVALRSDGRIILAPKFTPFADPNLAYLWALRVDSRGNLYAAGGTNAKVVRIDPAGKMTTAFESEELTAQAVTLDKNDNLYVATSPDGKVYKVTPNGQKSVFFDPKAKYIWDLALGPDGTLYVATGDEGKIFAVTPEGKGGEFYTSSETHIRAITFDGKGNLLAGTEPNGLVLRIPLAADSGAVTEQRGAAKPDESKQDSTDNAKTNSRKAYVIYETANREITALLPESDGSLYVGAIAEKTRGTTGFPQTGPPAAQPQAMPNAQNGQNGSAAITAGGNPQQPTAFLPFPSPASSSVYRIAADGSPEVVWTSRNESVYALGLSPAGKLLLGVGNQGAVIEMGPDRVFSRLAKTASEQVTGFARAANGKVYVATSNPANVFSLGPDLESEGSFESQTFDAHLFSRWGRLTWWGQNSADRNADVEFYVRAGNTSDPVDSWSPWFGPYRDPNGEPTQCPAARFVQWKVVLRGTKTPAPEISWVKLAYLPKNAAPQVDGIAIQDPGVRVSSFGQGGQSPSVPVQLHMPPTSSEPEAAAQRTTGEETARFEAPPQGTFQKGFQSVIWSADDPNDDDLVYTIYYHGENDKDWKLLKDKIEQKFYSWDTASMPDGAYYLKVVASDEPSNPPAEALTAERESERFIVDNTPPQITGLAADPSNATADSNTAPAATLRFRATDATSPIVKAQYSVDAGEWTLVLPVGAVSDSLNERYEFTLRNLAPGEHTVAVRASDEFDNLGAAEVTFTITAAQQLDAPTRRRPASGAVPAAPLN